jgi:hypothetical protein
MTNCKHQNSNDDYEKILYVDMDNVLVNIDFATDKFPDWKSVVDYLL